MSSTLTADQKSPAVWKTVATPPQRAERIAYWSSILVVVLSVAAFGLGFTTPPRSGPFCLHDCLGYPYTRAAACARRLLVDLSSDAGTARLCRARGVHRARGCRRPETTGSDRTLLRSDLFDFDYRPISSSDSPSYSRVF
jgi:hypothetical protein